MNINARAKELMDEMGLNQLQLSELIDEDPSITSRIIKGKKVTFTSEQLIKLAGALHTTVEYLVEGKGMRKISSKEKLEAALKDRKKLLEGMTKEEIAHHYEELKRRQEDLVGRIKDLQEEFGE